MITLTATANINAKQRIDTVLVSADGLDPQLIMVTQDAGNGTGVADLTGTDVSLYPIPVKNQLVISFPTMKKGTCLIIYNLNGTEVYTLILNKPITTIDMGNYSSEIYIFRIISPDSGNIIRKVLKE